MEVEVESVEDPVVDTPPESVVIDVTPEATDQVTDQVADQVTDQVTDPVAEEVELEPGVQVDIQGAKIMYAVQFPSDKQLNMLAVISPEGKDLVWYMFSIDPTSRVVRKFLQVLGEDSQLLKPGIYSNLSNQNFLFDHGIQIKGIFAKLENHEDPNGDQTQVRVLINASVRLWP